MQPLSLQLLPHHMLLFNLQKEPHRKHRRKWIEREKGEEERDRNKKTERHPQSRAFQDAMKCSPALFWELGGGEKQVTHCAWGETMGHRERQQNTRTFCASEAPGRARSWSWWRSTKMRLPEELWHMWRRFPPPRTGHCRGWRERKMVRETAATCAAQCTARRAPPAREGPVVHETRAQSVKSRGSLAACVPCAGDDSALPGHLEERQGWRVG